MTRALWELCVVAMAFARIDSCDMVGTHGMAENFDAMTRRGLRDPARSRTAAVFTLHAASNSK
ncbi:MAG: hypothetical protein ABW049_01780 [Spongiibacteraceae bacterium]